MSVRCTSGGGLAESSAWKAVAYRASIIRECEKRHINVRQVIDPFPLAGREYLMVGKIEKRISFKVLSTSEAKIVGEFSELKRNKILGVYIPTYLNYNDLSGAYACFTRVHVKEIYQRTIGATWFVISLLEGSKAPSDLLFNQEVALRVQKSLEKSRAFVKFEAVASCVREASVRSEDDELAMLVNKVALESKVAESVCTDKKSYQDSKSQDLAVTDSECLEVLLSQVVGK